MPQELMEEVAEVEVDMHNVDAVVADEEAADEAAAETITGTATRIRTISITTEAEDEAAATRSSSARGTHHQYMGCGDL